MTTPATDANPNLGPLLAGYDDVGHQKNVALRVKNVATDATSGVVYADLGVDVTLSQQPNQSVNITQWGGQAVVLDNTSIPAFSMRGKGAGLAGDTALLLDALGQMTIEQFIQYQIMQGHGFVCSTGLLSSATNTNLFGGMELFVNNVARNILVYTVWIENVSTSGNITLNQLTVQDAGLTATLTPANQSLGSGITSVATVTAPANNFTVGGAQQATGVVFQATGGANSLIAPLINSGIRFIAKNTANQGLAAYVKLPTAGNTYAVTMEWIEW